MFELRYNIERYINIYIYTYIQVYDKQSYWYFVVDVFVTVCYQVPIYDVAQKAKRSNVYNYCHQISRKY